MLAELCSSPCAHVRGMTLAVGEHRNKATGTGEGEHYVLLTHRPWSESYGVHPASQYPQPILMLCP